MTLNESETLNLIEPILSDDKDEEYTIPLDISDIINICKEFNSLGWQIHNQIDDILEIGLEESIINGSVKQDSLPIVKNFLKAICRNPYFGDACLQAQDCLLLIQQYEEKHKIKYISKAN